MSVSTCKTNIPVKRVHCKELSVDIFLHEYMKEGQPIVIEGCLQDLPCSKWNMEYLKSRVGKNEVEVRGRTHQQDYKVCDVLSVLNKNLTLTQTLTKRNK